MNEHPQSRSADLHRLERTFEAIGDGEEGYEMVYDPATGQIVAAGDLEDEDRVPATQMAREGFFLAC